MRDEKMNVPIRKLADSDHEYFAYTKSVCGKATFCLYFADGIWGAVVLCEFIQMLKGFFEAEEVKISLHESAVKLKNQEILTFLKEQP